MSLYATSKIIQTLILYFQYSCLLSHPYDNKSFTGTYKTLCTEHLHENEHLNIS